MKKIKIKFGFFSLLIIFSIISTADRFTYISLFAAAIHETGHLFASKIFGVPICEFNFSILGARLKTTDILSSYKQEILLCLFGPLFNFVSAFAVYLLSKQLGVLSDNVNFFIISSILLGALNLLPIRTFDGGRIIEAMLLYFFSPSIVTKIVNTASFITVFTLWLISVYFLLIYTSSLGLFVFCVALFCYLFIRNNA